MTMLTPKPAIEHAVQEYVDAYERAKHGGNLDTDEFRSATQWLAVSINMDKPEHRAFLEQAVASGSVREITDRIDNYQQEQYYAQQQPTTTELNKIEMEPMDVINVNRLDIRDAIQKYANRRNEIFEAGGDLEGEEVTQAKAEMIKSVGFHDPSKFDLYSWSLESYETDEDPWIDVINAEEFITKEIKRNIRKEIETIRKRPDKDRDGVPSGRYELSSDGFLRVGDTEDLDRYHGTVVPEGTIISEFTPSLGHTASENRPSIGNTPAVYSTPDADAALDYALGYNNAYIHPGHQGQLYDITIRPDEILDLGHCQDDASARLAIRKGFDVIECPDFWEQPETITFDPKKIEINAVYPVIEPSTENGEDFDTPDWTPEGNETIDEFKAEGFLGDSIYKSSDRRMSKVQDAVEQYKESSPVTTDYEPGTIMSKYPQMFAKKSSYSSRPGRGRMGY